MDRIKKAIKLAGLGLVLPLIGLAQGLEYPPQFYGLPGTSSSKLSDVIEFIIMSALGVAGITAVLFLIYGGFRYITSAGNEEQAEAGKKAIQNSIIGLIVIILSYVIVIVIINAL